MKKIFSKIFVSFLVIIIILTVVILYFSFNIIRENYQETLVQNMFNTANSIQLQIIPLLNENKTEELDSIVKILGKDLNSRITVINPQGIVLADSKSNPKKMENHSDRPEIIKALKSGEGTSLRHSYTISKDMLYVAVTIKVNNKLIGFSRVSLYMDDVDNLINTLRLKILELVLIVVLISLLIALFFSRTITNPIKELVKVSRAVADGNFNARSKIKSKDELKTLNDSLNYMIEQLRFLFNQTNQQKQNLDNIISSIHEGLVVLDSQSKIILSNQSFNQMVANDSVRGKFIWEILRDTYINKLIKKIEQSESNITSEIQFKGEYYLCSANHINKEKELVLIFYNISELKKLENIKKDFVVNVSHELRTPLTVIKGYIETIEDDIDVKNRKYIDIIKNHTDRLINIVQDLLTISLLEERGTKLDIEDIEMKSFFNNLSISFEQKLKEKNLSLNIEIDDKVETFKADEYKIEQMFINLIDNAIKYSETGGITINVCKDNSHVRFVVADTGIGIPEKDKNRIFERFYTVDKSHSRQTAGTGLGLAIVKHIVQLHKGKILVESQLGSGSKFIVLLPIYS